MHWKHGHSHQPGFRVNKAEKALNTSSPLSFIGATLLGFRDPRTGSAMGQYWNGVPFR